MVHGSGANSSKDRRIGFVIRYLNPDVMQEVASADYAILVRGADRRKTLLIIANQQICFLIPKLLFTKR